MGRKTWLRVQFWADRREGVKRMSGMRRKVAASVLAVAILASPVAAVGCKRKPAPTSAETNDVIGIHRRPGADGSERQSLDELPAYDASATEPFAVYLCNRDISHLDVSGRLADLLHADFDTRTLWPAELPSPFDPAKIMRLGRSPGLGIGALHRRGVTGQGVGVAIIDAALLVDHEEYADRLKYYDEIHCLDETADMHGVGVASIAVGKTVGVAPEADLYLIGETPGANSSSGTFDRDLVYVAQSIDRILQVNDLLPSGGKIRVISISLGWASQPKGWEAVEAAVERAKKAGVFVISTTSLTTDYGFRFHGLEREPLADPDEVSSYSPISGWGYATEGPRDILCVPMNSRTTAAPNGPGDYAFYRTGGWSWCVPYLAGLYALACQVDPDVTPDKFWSVALATGYPFDLTAEEPGSRAVIVNPPKLIEALQSGR